MSDFDWNSLPVADAAPTAPTEGAPAFDWNSHPVDDAATKEALHGGLAKEISTGAEGLANTLTFGAYSHVASAADKALGVDPSYHQQEREQNPKSYMAGQVAGILVGGGALKAAGALAETGAGLVAEEGGVLHSAVKGAIDTALFQSGDEIAKLGQGDPHQSLQTAATNVGLAFLLGGGLSAGAKVSAEALDGFKNKIIEHLGPEAPILNKGPFGNFPPAPDAPLFKEGAKEADSFIKSLLKKATASFTSADAAGAAVGAGMGQATHLPYGKTVGAFLGKKYIAPLLKPIIEQATNPAALDAASNYISAVLKGENLMGKAVAGVFEAGRDVLPGHLIPTPEDREKLQKSLDPNSVFQQGETLGHYLPGHDEALGQLAGNAAAYLEAVRPKSTQAGILSTDIKPSKAQQHEYDRALDLVNQPLIVLDRIKQGTLLPKDVVAFNALYPKLRAPLEQKLVEHMVDHMSKGNRVPYRTRMGLSLFLAKPLDGTMSPGSIQSAQSVFLQNAQAQQASQGNVKRGTSTLTKAPNNYLTPSESRMMRKSKP